MTTINVATVTQAQDFPVGTVDTMFDFVLVDSTGATVGTASSANGTAVFENVAPGVYTVTGTKNGVSASASVTVVAPSVALQVPQSITVTLS